MSALSVQSAKEVGPGSGPTSTYGPVVHLLIHVSGVVQGVGFRPFIYNLARRHGLHGTVRNTGNGVEIHVQGPRATVETFVAGIAEEAPTAARVDDVQWQPIGPGDFEGFQILDSSPAQEVFTHVSPDLALCADCRRELLDPQDRRHGYPFINCTNCGPRFTIIRAVPYDRPQTTMSGFSLCETCRREYESPANRRFHAQPVACAECGPQLEYLSWHDGKWTPVSHAEGALRDAVNLLRSGGILLLQGIGGFHLACDACGEGPVRELRRRKKRDAKPLAVMFPDLRSLHSCCMVSAAESRLLASSRAPILLLRRRAGSPIAEAVAPGNAQTGAMLPYSPLHELLLREFGGPLVMTSANLSDEPIAFRTEDALRRMSGIADSALVHERAIHMFCDDSVVKVIGGTARVWRRSRGYVPESVHVPVPFRRQTLALGPQMKNTFCLGKRSFALLSQHLGDLDSEHAIRAQTAALDHFLRLFDARIELIACDLHPDYTTTRLAEEFATQHGVPLVRVQHHHAHLASCLTENGRTEPAIGLTLDGTGYGTDGCIWGGEVLAGDARSFERVAHLQETFMPGGEAAAREPWRMALAWLSEAFGEDALTLQIPLVQRMHNETGEEGLHALTKKSLRRRVFPRTTSLGRLFDAVAALIFFGTARQHEGQAAMLLENVLSSDRAEPYPFEARFTSEDWTISPVPAIRELVADLQRGAPAAVMSRRFHEGVVAAFVRVCEAVRECSGYSLVALSGGCFQNAFLLTAFEASLRGRGFEVLSHRQVPPNDGGVSLGQAVVANAQEV